MKIGLITTLDTNIGDDFIRLGICRLLEEVFRGNRLEWISINKHKPYTVYPPWHPIHLRETAARLPVGKHYSRRFIEYVFPRIGFSRFDDCDLIVQCGAPVFWPNCSRNEWARPIWYEVIGRLHGKIPVMNLAAGACYPWEQQPGSVEDREDAEYLRTILDYCSLTTVRDELAERLASSLGARTHWIPCSAFLAAGTDAQVQDRELVLVNYMQGGGHYDWGQGIDPFQWKQTIRAVIELLHKRHRIALLCHTTAEYEQARELAPDLPCILPRTPQEYFAAVANAKMALCNRMHASMALAGMGIPSVAVGTDTRLLMVKAIGLPVMFVKDTSAERIIDALESFDLDREHDRLMTLQSETWNRYLDVMRSSLGRCEGVR